MGSCRHSIHLALFCIGYCTNTTGICLILETWEMVHARTMYETKQIDYEQINNILCKCNGLSKHWYGFCWTNKHKPFTIRETGIRKIHNFTGNWDHVNKKYRQWSRIKPRVVAGWLKHCIQYIANTSQHAWDFESKWLYIGHFVQNLKGDSLIGVQSTLSSMWSMLS